MITPLPPCSLVTHMVQVIDFLLLEDLKNQIGDRSSWKKSSYVLTKNT